MSEGGKEAVRVVDEVVAKSWVVAEADPRAAASADKKTLENEILREAAKIAHEKTHLVAAVVARGRYAVRHVAQVPGVSRLALLQARE